MFEEFANKELQAAIETFKAAEKVMGDTMLRIQLACPHDSIGQIPSDFTNDRDRSAERVCFKCGVAETSHYGNFKFLTHKFYADIGSADMPKHRIGAYWQHRKEAFAVKKAA